MIQPNLSIIVVNYNTKDLLADCLRSVFAAAARRTTWRSLLSTTIAQTVAARWWPRSLSKSN